MNSRKIISYIIKSAFIISLASCKNQNEESFTTTGDVVKTETHHVEVVKQKNGLDTRRFISNGNNRPNVS